MPQLVALLPLIFSGIGAGTAVGEGIASAVGDKKSAVPPAPTTAPTAPTGPNAPQVAAAANTQYATGGGTSPDYLNTLLNGQGLEPNPSVINGLSGYTT